MGHVVRKGHKRLHKESAQRAAHLLEETPKEGPGRRLGKGERGPHERQQDGVENPGI